MLAMREYTGTAATVAGVTAVTGVLWAARRSLGESLLRLALVRTLAAVEWVLVLAARPLMESSAKATTTTLVRLLARMALFRTTVVLVMLLRVPPPLGSSVAVVRTTPTSILLLSTASLFVVVVVVMWACLPGAMPLPGLLSAWRSTTVALSRLVLSCPLALVSSSALVSTKLLVVPSWPVALLATLCPVVPLSVLVLGTRLPTFLAGAFEDYRWWFGRYRRRGSDRR